METEELTEYERIRLDNIRKNEEVLAALGLGGGGASLLGASKKEKPKEKPKPKPRPVASAPPKATRGSRRLAGEEAEYQEAVEAADDSDDGSDDALDPQQVTVKFSKVRHGIARLTVEQAAKLDALEPSVALTINARAPARAGAPACSPIPLLSSLGLTLPILPCRCTWCRPTGRRRSTPRARSCARCAAAGRSSCRSTPRRACRR